jgi:hypothetical protein
LQATETNINETTHDDPDATVEGDSPAYNDEGLGKPQWRTQLRRRVMIHLAYKTERKGANRTGLEIERWPKIGLSSVSLFLPYVPLVAMSIDDNEVFLGWLINYTFSTSHSIVIFCSFAFR